MGAYAPSSLFDRATQARVMSEIVLPVLEGMRSGGQRVPRLSVCRTDADCGWPKVIEFNVRFGDPEAQVVLPMITDDLLGLLMSAAAGELATKRVSLDAEPRVGSSARVRRLSRTRTTQAKSFTVWRQPKRSRASMCFTPAQRSAASDIVTAGGRVLTVVASGSDYRDRHRSRISAVSKISFDGMHYRKDIGAKALV